MTGDDARLTCSVRRIAGLSRLVVEDDGHPVAAVDVIDDGAIVQLRFGVEPGHLPVQVRRVLVDAAFDLPVLKKTRPVHATVPLGDVELLAGLRRHCTHVDARAAGATCLVDAVVEP